MTKFKNVPLLTYVAGEELSVGIAQGRTMGLNMVTTKYTDFYDDDAAFDNNLMLIHIRLY